MKSEPRVAAVVVAYDGGDDLIGCLQSLLAQTVPDLEIIVVDNASSDGSIERAESAFGAEIRVIRRTTNGGYAAGANTGWLASAAPFVAIFNQDLTLAPDCLEQMHRVLVDESRDALVTPKLVMKSDPARVNAIGNDVHLSCVAWCHGLGTPATDWHGVIEVTAISGAAFMARRALLETLDGLEESYFMYMEDVDLSFRVRLAGGVCLAACDAVAAHGWSLALTPRKFGLLERNRRGVWSRFVGPSGRQWLVLLQAEVMGWAYAGLRGRRYLRAKWKAHNAPLSLEPGRPQDQTTIRSLSRRHPYEVLFPGSKLVAMAGGLTDSLVSRCVGVGAQ